MSAIETMSEMRLWIHIIVFAIVTYALRLSFIALFSYQDIPDQIKDHLRLIPPAILAAMAVPPLVFRDGAYHLSPTEPFILAGLAGGIVAWKTESLIGTITSGFIVFFGITYVR